MNNRITKSLFALGAATAILAAPGVSMDAEAKIKDQRFHFVDDAFNDPIVMTMKYKNGKWQWTNSNKSFKKRVKFKVKSSKKFSNGSIRLAAAGTKHYNIGIWQQAAGHKTREIEQLLTFTVNKRVLSSSQKAAAIKCDALGGPKRITTGLTLPAMFHVSENGRRGITGGLHISVICEARVKPATPKIASINFYTIPAKPVCNKPVSIVADFQGTHPGKYNFTLVRNDGAKQKNSTVLQPGQPLSSGRFIKTYTLKKTTERRYQIIMANQAMASKWIDVKVKCGVNSAQNKAKGIRG